MLNKKIQALFSQYLKNTLYTIFFKNVLVISDLIPDDLVNDPHA